jgi:uncharacterized protein (DUF2141 family)
MKTHHYKIAYFLCIGLNAFAQTSHESISIQIKVVNLTTNEGKVGVLLLNEEKKVVASAMLKVQENQCSIKFENQSAGKYAAKFFHDQNGNGKMDANSLGIPAESYGFSNGVKGIFGSPPEFNKTIFTVSNNTIIQLEPAN